MANRLLISLVGLFLLQVGIKARGQNYNPGDLRRMDEECLAKHIDLISGQNAAVKHSLFTGTKKEAIRLGWRFKRKLYRRLRRLKGLLKDTEDEEEDPIFESCGRNIQYCKRDSRFRTADGSCNNLDHPDWGKSNIAMRRWLKPEYGDGIASPRVTGSDNQPLKSARKISSTLFSASDESTEKKNVTHMVMQFAQFADHDLTSTAIEKGANGSTIICCQEDVPDADVNVTDRPQCFPISIPEDDERFKSSCMNFVRSIQVPNADCETIPVDQTNQITTFVDASQVYGSTEEETNQLRKFKRGLLKFTKTTTRRNLLPKNSFNDCTTSESPNFCFKAGDERVNEQTGLASMHTIWMREHNRLARKLAFINPRWRGDDERLFQEARRIVAAMMQHIMYTEFLPVVLNDDYIRNHKLSSSKSRNCKNQYNAHVDPSIRNSFATAAYRFGHSMIRTNFSRIDKKGNDIDSVPLTSMFGNTALILESKGNAINSFTRGLVTDTAQSVDDRVTPEVLNFLFLDKEGKSFDLIALNIQRGRDHGLPGYNKWREFCGLSKVSDFSVTTGLVDHSEKVAAVLEQLYSHPNDIDLFAGGVTEKPIPGGLIGPTFACLVARQFEALKFGDRFWYESCDKQVGFTRAQLVQLHKTSLAKVICDNTDISMIQRRVFEKASKVNENPLQKCRRIPKLNINMWKHRRWSRWSKWSPCQEGIKTRTRTCNVERQCRGPSRQIRKCRTRCRYGRWKKWGRCIDGCKSRTRVCNCKKCRGPKMVRRRCGRRNKPCGK